MAILSRAVFVGAALVGALRLDEEVAPVQQHQQQQQQQQQRLLEQRQGSDEEALEKLRANVVAEAAEASREEKEENSPDQEGSKDGSKTDNKDIQVLGAVKDGRFHALRDPQEAAREAAEAAHAAELSPAEIVEAAGHAVGVAMGSVESKEAVDKEIQLACERALGTKEEIAKAQAAEAEASSNRRGGGGPPRTLPELAAADTAKAQAAEAEASSNRKGGRPRTLPELAAADTAKAAEDAAKKAGEGDEAAIAGHRVAMGVEAKYGSNQGYMWGQAKEVPVATPKKEEKPSAEVQGLYAMWQAYRAGLKPAEVVHAAVEKVKSVGGAPWDIDAVTEIASNPDTFAVVGKFTNAKEAGEAAAHQAEERNWDLDHIAVAAARAAGTAQENNPGQTPLLALDAARSAAEWVMKGGHMSHEEVARQAAAAAKKTAEFKELRPPAVQKAVAAAAIRASLKAGAPPAMAAKFAEDARATVDVSPGTYGLETRMWDSNVYQESDKKKAEQEELIKHLEAGVEGEEEVAHAAQQVEVEGEGEGEGEVQLPR